MTTPPQPPTPYNTPVPGSIPSSHVPPTGQAASGPGAGPSRGVGANPGEPLQPGAAHSSVPAVTGSSAGIKKARALPIAALVVAGVSLLLGGVGLIFGITAFSANAELRKQVDTLRAQQAEVDTALASLNERTGEGLADYLQDLDRRVSAAESAANEAASEAQRAAGIAQYAEDYAFSVDGRLGGVVECINTYMKTVGDSGGGYYRYYFC